MSRIWGVKSAILETHGAVGWKSSKKS